MWNRRRSGILGATLVVAMGLSVLLTAAPRAEARSVVYVQSGQPLTYRPGTSQPDPLWTEPDFGENAAWIPSTQGFGIGYGDGDDNTELTDMRDTYQSVYVRSHFTVGAELTGLTQLRLNVWYDDGFVAYVNGVEVARANVPAGPLSYDSGASGNHEASDGPEVFVLDPALLLPGDNVFAVEVHNVSLGSSDLSLRPTLWALDSDPVSAAITVGPYLQQISRRSVLVCWETDLPAPSAVSYGVGSQPDEWLEDPTERTRHELRLTGLLPATTYRYHVDSAWVPSESGAFYTEQDAADAFRFVVFGDTRSNHGDHRDVVERIADEGSAFLVHTGDLVGNGEDPADWTAFFDVEGDLLRDVVLYPVLGNHEADGVRYLELFAPPDDLAPGTENYYALTYSTVAVVMLDLYLSDFTPGSAQYAWLEDTLSALADDPTLWLRFVALHHGPYDSGPHGSNHTVRDHLAPLFAAHGVDVVFAGHDHTYERSTVDGVKYVVTGGGGAPLYTATGDWWTEVAESVLHYVVVDVHGPRATVSIKRLDGTTLDQFVLNDGLTECTQEADCAGLSPAPCEPDEDGEWVCVQGGCVWSCSLATVEPDAGTPAPDGGTVTPDGGTDPPGERGGCGCAHRSPESGTLFWALLIGGMLLWWRRRRR